MAEGDLWFFDRIARLYRLGMPAADAAPLERGLAHADREVERLLDVGGGTGRAASATDAPERLVLDASRSMLREASPELARVQASAAALPLAAASVDAALIVDALHHLPDRDRVLAEVARVLRPGGVLVVRDFDPGTLRGRLVEAAEHLIRMESRFLGADAVAGMMADAGLDPAVLERGFTYTVAGRKPGGS